MQAKKSTNSRKTTIKISKASSKKKKTKELLLITPDVQIVHTGSGRRQEAKYLQLDEGLGKTTLDHDLANGATPYEGLPRILSHGDTQYNIIVCKRAEDGIRAVNYVAGCHLTEKGINLCDRKTPEESATTDETKPKYLDPDSECGIDFHEPFPSELDDLFEEDPPFPGEPCFDECMDRIPIIPMKELLRSKDVESNPYGQYAYQMNCIVPSQTPWWINCNREKICILKDTSETDGFFFEGLSEDTLSPDEIKSLKRFSGNDQVYLIIVSDEIDEADFSVNACMLEYTANCFYLHDDPKNIADYRTTLLLNSARKHGFQFSKNLDVPLMAEKLSAVNPQYPCNNFDKIMDYLTHIGAPKVLSLKDFEPLGLSKVIEKVSQEKNKMSLDKELVGMDQVKKQVESIINIMHYNRRMEKEHLPGGKYHNVHLFIGAPGTAKTTVAELMANRMCAEGLLPGSRFTSVTGAQLKGLYVGHTAPKVHALFQENDAILIDEAYSLSASDHGGLDTFAQEALAQLAVELEQHATDKLVIFAGYGGKDIHSKNNLMYQFLQANPGINSRIASTITFSSYSPEEMLEIVRHLARKSSLTLPKGCEESIKEYFASRQFQDDFGNGREARVFLDQCKRNLAQRVMTSGKEPTRKDLTTITLLDVNLTIQELQNSRVSQLGQHMTKLGFI